MKDLYPAYDTVPADWLVPPEAQPEYLAPAGQSVGETLNLADLLIDRHVRDGRGDRVAVHLADDGSAYTYAQLSAASARLAHALQELGVEPATGSPSGPRTGPRR